MINNQMDQTEIDVPIENAPEPPTPPYYHPTMGGFSLQAGLNSIAAMRHNINQLENAIKEIQEQILDDLKSMGGYDDGLITATVKTGRATVNNRGAVEQWVGSNPHLMADYADALAKASSLTVSWSGVVKEIGVPNGVLKAHTKPGKPTIKVEVIEQEVDAASISDNKESPF